MSSTTPQIDAPHTHKQHWGGSVSWCGQAAAAGTWSTWASGQGRHHGTSWFASSRWEDSGLIWGSRSTAATCWSQKVLPVVEGVIEGGQQAVGGERSPACGEDWEQNEDRGEGTCFEAHVNVHLKGPLQTHQTQLAGLAEAHRVRVGVDAQRVVPERTQDAHERVQHHQEWYKEEHQHNEHHVSMVVTLNRVAKNTLRCSGGNVQGWMANGKWEGKAERQRPRDRDQHFGPAWTKFVLLLHDD